MPNRIMFLLLFLLTTSQSMFADPVHPKRDEGSSLDPVPEGMSELPVVRDGRISGEGIQDSMDAWQSLSSKIERAQGNLEPMKCFRFARTLIFASKESQMAGEDPETVRINLFKHSAFPPAGCSGGAGFIMVRPYLGDEWECFIPGYLPNGRQPERCLE